MNHILLECLPNIECRPSAINSPVALFFTSTTVPAYPPFRPKTFEVISNSSYNFSVHKDHRYEYDNPNTQTWIINWPTRGSENWSKFS